MNLAHIHRLLQLISLLQAGRAYNIDALALECNVSRRTIFRDLELVRQSGIPILFDEKVRQYRIPGACLLPPTNFSLEEALSLIVLCHDLGNGSGLPFLSSARSAVVKLESALPSQLREQLRGFAEAVHIQPPSMNPLEGQKPVFDELLEAIHSRHSVRIRYNSLKEGCQINTRLSPYRLFFSRHSWYVVGRSSIHRATRMFNLSRMVAVETLDDVVQIPKNFSLDRYLRNAWHLIPEKGPNHKVLVHFQKLVAQNVAEITWHKTQQLTFLEDGSLEFRVTVSGLNEISWWILGYGDQAKVIEPPELRQLIADRIKRMAEIYP
jgi:proteasome accessory factor B